MPEKRTLDRARADRRAGKAASTQAGEFIREQIEHIRQGKHGARSTKQAIAIGLSEARRAGVDLPPPKSGKASAQSQKQAARDYARGQGVSDGNISRGKVSRKRSRSAEQALKREGSQAASAGSLARQARAAAARRSPAARSASARQAARTRKSEARDARTR
ncbi:MAG TPA: DUF6496 domain-containing protein [Steroidobacteraceae bacterium]|jgi:hypothetical protein